MKIALCGPPHSGKSVLRHRLKTELHALAPTLHPFVLTANPDGEGAWFQPAYENDPAAALTLKKTAKQRWTPQHADLYSSWVRNTTAPLVLIDLGGVIDDSNRQICALATHALLLAPSEDGLLPWRAFSTDCSLTPLAELLSDYHATEDLIYTREPFRASVHRLERGELSTPRPAISALAAEILRLLHLRDLHLP